MHWHTHYQASNWAGCAHAEEIRRPTSTSRIVANPPPGSLSPPARAAPDSIAVGLRAKQDVARPQLADWRARIARMVDPAMNEAMAQTARGRCWACTAAFSTSRNPTRARLALHPQRRADEIAWRVLGLGQMGASVAARLAPGGYRLLAGAARAESLPGVIVTPAKARLDDVLARRRKSSSTCCR